jgi:predicted Zn-dependent peptidase
MKEQNIQTHEFDNGLTLVIEPMSDVQSASFSLLVPSGSVFDPAGGNGSASVLCELLMRGAGHRDSVQLLTDLENLGVQHSNDAGCNHLTFSGATLAENLCAALRIYGDILQRPHLPPDQFDSSKAVIEQALRAIEDEPRQKVMVELRRRCYDAPWGLPSEGNLDDLDAIDLQTVRGHFERCFRPNGTILGIAGNVDVKEVKATVEAVFGGWQPKPAPTFQEGPRGPQIDWIEQESEQIHIGIAYDAVPYPDPDYYAAWAAVGVLSGGMSSRLFTEVRERRGLCYSVHAALSSLPHAGRVLCYAGTKIERAQETLDVTLHELVRLGEGIEPCELDRCKARAKSSLVMQQESTIARSSSIARDWFYLKRVKTLAEVRDIIEALTVDVVLDYVHRRPAGDFTVLTIGPRPLDVPAKLA